MLHTSPSGLTSLHIVVCACVGWVVKGARKSMKHEYIRVRVNNILINRQFRLNHMIDQKERKPPEVFDDQWNRLVRRRATKESKLTTKKMRKVAKGKCSNSKYSDDITSRGCGGETSIDLHFVIEDSKSL